MGKDKFANFMKCSHKSVCLGIKKRTSIKLLGNPIHMTNSFVTQDLNFYFAILETLLGIAS